MFDTQTDEDIARAVQGGDGEAFGELMRRYQAKLTRYGRKFIAEKENIDDVVQDVFVRSYQAINSFDPSLKFSSWIYRIAHNSFVNELRRIKRAPVFGFEFDTFIGHDVYEDPHETEQNYADAKAMVEKGLADLKSQHREVLVLHYLEELSYHEISDILHIPVSTVGVRLLRAREALKKTYQNNPFPYERA